MGLGAQEVAAVGFEFGASGGGDFRINGPICSILGGAGPKGHALAGTRASGSGAFTTGTVAAAAGGKPASSSQEGDCCSMSGKASLSTAAAMASAKLGGPKPVPAAVPVFRCFTFRISDDQCHYDVENHLTSQTIILVLLFKSVIQLLDPNKTY